MPLRPDDRLPGAVPSVDETGFVLDQTATVAPPPALGGQERDRLPVGTLINGRYRVDGFLGSGGMGSVYRVTDLMIPDRVVALKTIRREIISHDQIDLFKAEFRTMTGFRHPNVASVYDFEPMRGSGTYLFTMELIDGRDVLTATEGADTEAVLDVFVQICRALAYVHSRNVIHFDLKPGNVLIGGLGRVKVLDFGIAAAARHGGHRVTGTPAYMAPEMLDVATADHRADLYSLGIMFYQLLARRVPFEADAVSDLLRLHAVAALDFEGSGARAIPSWLRAIIERLCAKQAADRFRSANAVIEAINRGGGRTYELETPQTRESYIVSSRFIGRERELERVLGFVRDRTGGSAAAGPVLLVSGASGVGKSRLMREVRHHVQLSGLTFIEANCYEGSISEYAPIAEAIWHLVRLADALGAPALPGELPPEFVAGGAPPPVGPGRLEESGAVEREQLRQRDQTTAFLMRVAERAPIVLNVNDLQWAQSGTMEMLSHLVRRLTIAERTGPRARLALIGTFRDDEIAGRPLELHLTELQERRAAEVLSLAPLEAGHVGRLIASMLGAEPPAAFVQRLASETAGVPFFVEEVMRTLVENGSVYLESGAWAAAHEITDIPISTGIVNVLRRRAAALEPAARLLLRTLAAYGHPASPHVLAAATGFDPPDVASVLKVLLQRRMAVRVPGDPVRYGVGHDRMRETIYADLSEAERRDLHHRLGAAIERIWPDDDGEHVYELAQHWWLAGDRDKAFAYGLRGAERARTAYANDVAIELYTRVLGLCGGDDANLALEITEKLGDLSTLNGRFEKARAWYRQALGARRAAQDRARLFRKIAGVDWQRGQLGASVDVLWQAVETLGDIRPRSALARAVAIVMAVGTHLTHRVRPPLRPAESTKRARLLECAATYLGLGEAYFFHDSSQMLLPILRASNAGERAGVPSGELCRAYHAVMVLYGTLTLWGSAVAYARRLTEMAEKLDSAWHIGAAHTYRLILHYYRSEWALGIEEGRRGKDLLSRCGDVTELSFAYWVTALCHYYRGELRQAADWAREGLETMQRADSEQPSKGILAVSGRVNARLGRIAEAREQIERSLALARQARDLLFVAWAQMMMGDCLLVAGEPDEAVAWLESARREREVNHLLPEFLVEIYSLLAVARLQQLDSAGDLHARQRDRRLREIAAIARTARRLSRRRRHYQSPALRATALCAWRQGHRHRATKLFERSVAVANALGAPLHRAEANEAWGHCLIEAGETERAGDHLEQARQVYEDVGAAPLAARVVTILERGRPSLPLLH